MNVSLNGFAMFNCTAIATSITWEIDGVLINSDKGYLKSKGFDDSASLVTLDSTQDLRGTSLRVLGSSNNSNASITCVAITFLSITPPSFAVNRSEPALMLVQGKSVSYIPAHVININWGKPE